jgi:hypothetical protein
MGKKSQKQQDPPATSGEEFPVAGYGGFGPSDKAALDQAIDRFLFTPRQRGPKRAIAFLEDWMRRYSR